MILRAVEAVEKIAAITATRAVQDQDLWRRSNQTFDLSDPATFAFVEDAILDARAVQYGVVAGFVIWIYDFLLTMSDEVDLFWKKTDRRLIKVLYLMVRIYY